MKKIAVIVKDHKTYVHAEEAWYHFHGKKKNSVLFVVIPEGDPNNVVETLNEIIDENLWEEVVWVKTKSNFRPRYLLLRRRRSKFLKFYSKYREYLYNFLDVRKINNIASKYKGFYTVFSGHKNTQEHLAARLKPKELYLIDSGNFNDKINNSGYVDYSEKNIYRGSRVGRFLFKLTGLELFNRDEVKLFTVYAGSLNTEHNTIKNNQDYKRKLICKKNIGDDVLFISSPIYTFAKGVTISEYITYLEKIFDALDVDYSRVIYVPNPIRENDEDVETITKALGCTYDSRPIPVELKITKYDQLPRLCISPYSTALVNIQEISSNNISLYCAWHPEFDYFDQLVKLRESQFEIEGNGINFFIVKDAPSLFKINSTVNNGEVLYANFGEWNQKAEK